MEENKATAKRLYEEVFEGGNLALANELVDPDCRDLADVEDRRGPERTKEVATMLRQAFPDQHWDILTVIAEGNRVAMHCKHSGTHKGTFMGIPPTDKSFSVNHLYLFEFRNGKVITYQAVRDDLRMMQQLGVIPGRS